MALHGCQVVDERVPGGYPTPVTHASGTDPVYVGKAAEILFLQLMIVHHRAGVDMAKAAQSSGDQPRVVRLARSMVEGQSGEINLMTDMLKKRGATPWPAAS